MKKNQTAGDEQIKALMDKIKSGKASADDLFVAIDKEGDGNGKVSKKEF